MGLRPRSAATTSRSGWGTSGRSGGISWGPEAEGALVLTQIFGSSRSTLGILDGAMATRSRSSHVKARDQLLPPPAAGSRRSQRIAAAGQIYS